jgi:transcriptional regulator with XRE-family HTH domain
VRTAPQSVAFEEFDLADRLRRTLRVTGIGVSEMAADLGVSREAVGTWINGRIIPRRSSVMAWALRTGASFDWLMYGTNDKAPDPSGPGAEECTPSDLNREPTD